MGSEALLAGVSGINFSSDYSLHILISNNPQIQYFPTFPTFFTSSLTFIHEKYWKNHPEILKTLLNQRLHLNWVIFWFNENLARHLRERVKIKENNDFNQRVDKECRPLSTFIISLSLFKGRGEKAWANGGRDPPSCEAHFFHILFPSYPVPASFWLFLQ